ncbi:MAG: phosphate acetyltransferase [Spirochaetota bacterium]|nr:phosphate acetyltransferase [Spirochaetota bacterium]
MSKNIYLASSQKGSGKSVVGLGLMNSLRGVVTNVGYFKPVGEKYNNKDKFDKESFMIKEIFNIDDELKYINPISIKELNNFISDEENELFFQNIRESYAQIEKDKDIVIIDGCDNTGLASILEFDINIDIANNLDAGVLLVEDGRNKSIDEIVSDVIGGRDAFKEQASDFLGVIVNKVDIEQLSNIEKNLKNILKKKNIDLLGVVPYDNVLSKPRLYDIGRSLGAKILFGDDYLSNIATETVITSMAFENALKYLKDGSLIITGGDRTEILLGSFISYISPAYPNISGIVLTGGLMPNESIIKLIGNLSNFSFPILSVEINTLKTANIINSLDVHITIDDKQKIEIAESLVYKYVDIDKIKSKLEVKKIKKRTPDIFKYELIERARSNKKCIVLPEGSDERTLMAVRRVRAREIADIILLGDKDSILKKARDIDLILDSGVEIIDPIKSPKLEAFVNEYMEIRKHKHCTIDIANDLMQDPIYFGTMMVYNGDVDGLVSGAVHTTRHTIKPAFEIIKTQKNISVASSIFFMCLKDNVLVYGDCAINPNPNAEELAVIAISSADTAKAFGIEPYVALLSYSTGVSGKGPEVDKVKEATEIAKSRRSDLFIEGPIQYDAAVDMDVASVKLPNSKVAGRASVLIFPDLNTGNNTYKAVQRSSGSVAIGPVIQGLNKPVNDLSRGCLVEDIIYTIAITAIQAQV